jgi:predicted ester cyclase
MNAAETVKAVLTAIEQQQWDTARSYLADDFTFSGAVPQPLSADAWLGVHRALAAAMPDFSFNARDFREDGGKVYLTVAITGTQTRELALPVPGIPALAPTGKRVSMPAEACIATMSGDKLVDYNVSQVDGGGLPGILAQLGVSMPGAH